MDSKKSILICHPEGNIYNNPNMYEIIKLIIQYYDVDILTRNRDINDGISEFEEHIIQYNNEIFSYRDELRSGIIYHAMVSQIQNKYLKKKYDFIIGVDKVGAIDAYFLSKNMQVPYAQISYEILFRDENIYGNKELEVEASKGVEFVIIQDVIRGKKLSQENKIPMEKIHYIPVSSSNSSNYLKNYYLYDKLNIPRDKKILIFIGETHIWTCIDKIIKASCDFPDDWVLVLHNRYGNTKEFISTFMEVENIPINIYFSSESVDLNSQLSQILHSADLGIGLYCPIYSGAYLHPNTGKNIKYIGLSSGKISTYLQNGLPVIVYDDTMYSQKIDKYNFGYAVKSVDDIANILENFKPNQQINEECLRFFYDELDFNNYKSMILEILNKKIAI